MQRLGHISPELKLSADFVAAGGDVRPARTDEETRRDPPQHGMPWRHWPRWTNLGGRGAERVPLELTVITLSVDHVNRWLVRPDGMRVK